MKTMIRGEQIVKAFGAGTDQAKVLDGVSVDIQEGEFVSVMGPSGSGKSTLMYALSGMDGIDSGRVLFEDKELSALSEQELADLRRTRMGFVFQQPTLLKNLNLLDNIILPSMRDNRKNAAGLVEKARGMMKKTGIAELEKRETAQVSGGQLQRAGICRALMGNPKVIFGDEPTGALNSSAAEEIMDLLASIHEEGTTVVLVTHDAKVAARSGRILFMRDGAIVSELLLPRSGSGGTTDMDSRVSAVLARMQELGI